MGYTDVRSNDSIPQHGQGTHAQRAALKIAGRGKPVFPCKHWPDKSPLTGKGGFHNATTDPGKVSAYWNKYPDASIGVPTGRRSGVFVVDVDRLEALGELPQELPSTLIIRTPSGGLHHVFNYVEGITNSPGALPDGIDVRGEGGYVLVPPSPGYKVIDWSPVADAPDWLLEALRHEPRKSGGPGRSRPKIPDGEPIPEGSRNRTLFFYALDLKDQGRGHDEVLDRTLATNASRCTPPLPEDEVSRIVKSAMRYPIRSGPRSPEVEEFADLLDAEWWETVWNGKGGKTDRDTRRVLIDLARRYGRLTSDGGIEVTASVRVIALAAATNYVTVSRGVTKRLVQAGKVVKLDRGRGPQQGATWRLYVGAQTANTKASLESSREEMLTVSDLRAGDRKRSWDLETPAFRWSGLVGKGREGVLYFLEAYGPMTREELAEHLGIARARDVERRYLESNHEEDEEGNVTKHRPGLIELGLVEDRDGVYALVDEYEKRIDEVRNTPYTTQRKVKKISKEGRQLSEVESGARASEVEREAKDRAAYERHRQAHAQHLAALRAVGSVSFEELSPVAAQPPKAERPGPSPRLEDATESDIKAMTREVDELERQGMKRKFAIEEVYGRSA